MNYVILMGNISTDITMRTIEGEKKTVMGTFSLAVVRKYKSKGQPDADFIKCTALGRVAENINQFFKKGSKVFITGEWHTGCYLNKNGEKVRTNYLQVSGFEFVTTRAESLANGTAPEAMTPSTSIDDGGFLNIPDTLDDTLPFN